MNSIKYRPDIDGLRALAVIMVVLFHTGIKPFGGGFVGVDVFFVISGYLITSLILNDLREGRFSLPGFWERRIRRILPALAGVVFITLAIGILIFLPNDLLGLGKQTAWQSITASNFYFWQQVDYFNTEHELQPLLHTWSLAVEEQFYLLFPLLALLVWHRAKLKLGVILWAVCIISFAASVWAVAYNPTAAFFLLPFRAWELMVGALLAYHKPVSVSARVGEIGAFAGLAMVVAAGIFFTSKTAFPGAAALLPCLGTALLIWSGGAGTFVSRMASHRIPVFVGLVSYSWYLWHWPVLCFAEYVLQDNLDKKGKLVCLVVGFALAVLSWKFIEKPFRRPGGVLPTRKAVFIAAFIVLSLMAASGLALKTAEGLPQRLSAEAEIYAEGVNDRNEFRPGCDQKKFERLQNNDVCEANPASGKKPSFILWGDSQADAIIPAFAMLSKKYGVNGYFAVKPGCPPIIDVQIKNNDTKKPYCHDYNTEHLRFIKEQKIKDVFFVANWTSWVRNRSLSFDDQSWYPPYKDRYDNILMAGVQRTVDALHAEGIRVHFVINQPSMNFDPPRALAVHSMTGIGIDSLYLPKKDYLSKREKDINGFIANNEGKDFVVYDMTPILCPEERCEAQHDGHSLYFDHGHLSAHGALYVSSLFEKFFQKKN